MAEALALARRGIGLASPNPCVGAVVVAAGGRIIGRGFHTYDGLKHAEVLALDEAGAAARGATLYLNLEPCCHTGRTGPCVDRVIAAGVKHVVVAIEDPNPVVRGTSLERLRAAGIAVTAGVQEAAARKLNEAFAKHVRTGTPLITLKAGMTLDGKIAPPPEDGDAPNVVKLPVAPVDGSVPSGPTGGWITSREARAHVQQLRHSSDAVMVGVGTVIADDPRLTDRTGQPRRRPLLRVILDSRLRLPLESRVVKTAQDDVLVFCSFAEEKRRRELESRGVRVEQVSLGLGEGRPNLRRVAERLGALDITSLIIEGGALLNWAALASDVVDKVFLYYAPKILAGTGSVPFAAGPGFRRLGEAAKVGQIELHRFGVDFAVEGYLHDPYAWTPGPEKTLTTEQPQPEPPRIA